MNVSIKKDPDSGEFYIDLYELQDYFDDISVIEYYKLEQFENGNIALSFFDKNDETVKPKVKYD